MSTQRRIKLTLTVLAAAIATACGGGGGSGADPLAGSASTKQAVYAGPVTGFSP